MPVNEEHSDSGSEEEFQDSRSSPGDLEESTPAPGIFLSSSKTEAPQIATTSVGGPISSGEVDIELNTGEGVSQEDLIEAKFYQEAVINYQNAYEALLAQQGELQGKFEAQSHLIQEASAAIDVAETEAKTHHQELLCVRQDQQKEMDSAVSKMVEQYKYSSLLLRAACRVRIMSISLRFRSCRKKSTLWKYHSLSMGLQVFHLSGCPNRC